MSTPAPYRDATWDDPLVVWDDPGWSWDGYPSDEVVPTPRLTGLEPAVAIPTTAVTVAGAWLDNVTSVAFGALRVDAAEFLEQGPDAIVVAAPVHPAAPVELTARVALPERDLVSNPLGFTFPATALEAVTPNGGNAGDRVRLDGRWLDQVVALEVDFETAVATIPAAEFLSQGEAQILFVLPEDPRTEARLMVGPVVISAVTMAGERASIGFVYVPRRPTLRGLGPFHGQAGDLVTLYGRDLDFVTALRFGQAVVEAADFLEHSAEAISLIVPEP